MKKFGKLLIAAVVATLLFAGAFSVKAEAKSGERYNVVFVIDNSGSMSVTDGPNYRFEAVRQFVGLLAEDGNKVGGVLFAPEAYNPQPLKELPTQESRNAFVTAMMNPGLRDGGTNIGAALAAANNLLAESGDPDLPSVIVLLSDGNTELKKDQMEASLQAQAEAVQKAVDDGVKIYSICLNAPNSAISADPEEMENIAAATNGVSQTVATSEDLGDVFRMFYNLIYGTQSIEIEDTATPDSGVLDIRFEVPTYGADEVNLVIYGHTSSVELYEPGGAKASPEVNQQSSFSIVKLKNPASGVWNLKTNAAAGEHIRVNMVVNSNVTAEPELQDANGNPVNLSELIPISDDAYLFRAPLSENGTTTKNAKDYQNYSASLRITNAQTGEEVKRMELQFENGAFQTAFALRDITEEIGSFRFETKLYGNITNYFNTENVSFLSKTIPLADSLKVAEEVKINQAPVAKEENLEYTVKVWPFKGGHFEIDLKTLAEDPDGDALFYSVTSPFPAGTDYTIDSDNVLRQDHFSFRSGTYKVVVSDTFDASCTVNVKVNALSIALVTVLGLLAAGLVVLAILGILLVIALKKPFYGEFEVYMLINGAQTDIKKIKPRRGRLKLKNMKVPVLSRKLDYDKSYFQAEGRGKRYVTLVTNYPVSCNGPASKQNRFESDVQKTIVVDGNQSLVMYVKFKSRQKLRRSTAGTKRPAGRNGSRPTGNRR